MSKYFFLPLLICFCLGLGFIVWLLSAMPVTEFERAREEVSTASDLPVQEQSPNSTSSVAPSPAAQSSLSNPLSSSEPNVVETEPEVEADVSSQPSAASSQSAETRAVTDSATPLLGERVMAVIQDVQQKQLDGDWEASLEELNALYEDFDTLNSFEQTTMLNFYTNVLIRMQMWPEAIGAFSRMITIPNLREDLGVRALMALGQLHAQVGEYAASVSYLESWQNMTVDMENMEGSRQSVAELLERSRTALQQSNVEVN